MDRPLASTTGGGCLSTSLSSVYGQDRSPDGAAVRVAEPWSGSPGRQAGRGWEGMGLGDVLRDDRAAGKIFRTVDGVGGLMTEWVDE